MTDTEELGEALVAAVGADASYAESFGEVTVEVPRDRWVSALAAARDDLGCAYFDWLSGVDERDDGYAIFCHLWSVPRRHGVLLRTLLPRADARLATATGVFAGAAWHERETYEMFGVVFEGHPHLVPLLLPDGFEGHPLRKDFVLASRVAKAWPGAKEPGESGSGAPSRRRMRPPGVPDDWGPEATARGEEPARPRRAPRERARPSGPPADDPGKPARPTAPAADDPGRSAPTRARQASLDQGEQSKGSEQGTESEQGGAEGGEA